MLLHIPAVLAPDEWKMVRATVDAGEWIDGRRTAGEQAVKVKQNEQLAQGSEASRAMQALILRALNRNPLFLSATLPRKVLPPLFNRYRGAANHYGNHVDGAMMAMPGGQERIRSDISCTLFLAEPDEYEGGELVIEDTFGPRRVKLPAGHMVLYPSTSVHRVEPVTRGARVASFFWVESMVRSDEQRRLLFDLDGALMDLRTRHGEDEATVRLAGTYHNLLRMWGQT
ncbi:Fe2+-dependent dioxygenase [Aquabacterium lacunae]|uniref:Fe2+-dependent dioxygenase n=1 Tax=Aquabacterium lacunae TaxID=2528630 RepID=A0A4V2JFK8_9BURK|nr:Fe2+-dependent dioxygenase [Aquabacterium lacunae]TBO30290.1 Fe2+-dependent dioxygenase [Aquabacterium lacunae]